MKSNGCSIYLWANKQNDLNIHKKSLAVIAGFGFVSCTTKIEQEVLNVEDAEARLKDKPEEEKSCFWTYDLVAGTLGKYDAKHGTTGLQKR